MFEVGEIIEEDDLIPPPCSNSSKKWNIQFSCTLSRAPIAPMSQSEMLWLGASGPHQFFMANNRQEGGQMVSSGTRLLWLKIGLTSKLQVTT